jgi:putative ABC transport system permease protein
VAGAAVLSTLLFGLVPAWRASRPDLDAPLKGARGATGGRRHTRLRAALLVGELALSMILLVGAGLLVRSFQQLQAVEHGFEPDGLLAVSLLLPHSRYGGQAQHDAFYDCAIEELAALPGVVGVAGTTEPPVVGFNNTFSFVIEGRPATEPSGREQPVEVPVVTPGFFATMGIPVLEGRAFTSFDRAEQPGVVVVNRTFARRFWPGESAVGKRIGFDDHDGPWLEVVGVVGDIRQHGLDRPTEPTMYMPHAQKRWGWMSWLTLMVRTRGDPLDIAAAARQAIWSLDDRLPIRELAPVTRLYAESHARRRFAATLTGGFAGIALFLALFGIFGVVSYTVAQREREIGVRMALGARRHGVLLEVLRHGLVIATVGVALGAIGALLLTRLMQSLLFGVTATDPVTFAATAALLVAVALLASWLPARRAARIDPMEALRHE